MVGLYDHLQFRKVSGGKKIRLRVNGFSVAQGEDNLVVRMARVFWERYNLSGGLEIDLLKNIPVSAGLGGGSSDAAVTVRALCRLWGIRPSPAELVTLCRSLGSDIPFFLYGPTALVEAAVEEVHPVKLDGKGWVVLVDAGVRVSTTWVYQRLDNLRRSPTRGKPGRDRRMWLTLLQNQTKMAPRSKIAFQLAKISPYLYNDLEAVTEKYHPVIGTIKDRLRYFGADGVLMSGSGPTVFGLFSHYHSAQKAARGLLYEDRYRKVWVARVLKRKPS